MTASQRYPARVAAVLQENLLWTVGHL